MLLYAVLAGKEKVAMLSDTSLTNNHLIQHNFLLAWDFHRSTWIRKLFLSEIIHCSEKVRQRLQIRNSVDLNCKHFRISSYFLIGNFCTCIY